MASRYLDDGVLSFLLFPVDRPEFFDAVVTDDAGRVLEIQVKSASGSQQMGLGRIQNARDRFHRTAPALDRARAQRRVLRNAGERLSGRVAAGPTGVHAGRTYVDVGTVNGYREAMKMLGAAYERV